MVFELFPLLKERLEQAGGTLSGGEQQMLAIGRALMSRPAAAAARRAVAGPGAAHGGADLRDDRGAQAPGRTILLVEQNVHHALDVADRAYVLETGRDHPRGPGGRSCVTTRRSSSRTSAWRGRAVIDYTIQQIVNALSAPAACTR